VLVDELDHLVTRRQSVLYNLFEWPTRPNAGLVIVGIANTMDLPERLIPRVSSRLGSSMARVTFQPYTAKQILTIIKDRLEGLDVFKSEAIDLCSRKVASASGDVRTALQICRRAAKLAGARGDACATLEHVNAASREISMRPLVHGIRNLMIHDRLFIVALMKELMTSGRGDATHQSVAQRQRLYCRARGISEVPDGGPMGLITVASRLIGLGLIHGETATMGRARKLSLGVVVEELCFALQDDPLVKDLLDTGRR